MIIALLSSAFAADLDARLTTPSGEVKSMTFHNVEQSAPPPFEVQMNGATVRVTLAVTQKADAWVVEAELAEVNKRGRAKVLSAPRITLNANEPGLVRQGARIPVPNTNPVEFREESWQLDVTVKQS